MNSSAVIPLSKGRKKAQPSEGCGDRFGKDDRTTLISLPRTSNFVIRTSHFLIIFYNVVIYEMPELWRSLETGRGLV